MGEPITSKPADAVRSMIEQVVKSIVDDGQQVSVELVEEAGETVLELKVAQRDVGKVIGRQGRTIRAMRNLVSACGSRANKRFALEIIEDDIGEEDEIGEAAKNQPGEPS